MRHLASLALGLSLLFLFAGPAPAQDLSPELQRLDMFIGEWTYDDMDGATMCERLGDFIVHCTSDWTNADGNLVETVWVIGYNTQTERFQAYRFYSSGYWDSGTGWIEDGNWVTVYDARNGNKVKQISTITEDTWTFQWFSSVRGVPWESTSDGSATKVR